MDKSPRDSEQEIRRKFRERVAAEEARKLRARRERERGVWFGLSVIGTIGWAVALPTLIGIALGAWIDSRSPGAVPWTLSLLLIGLIFGCLNAWYWVMRQQRAMERDREERRRE